MTTTHPMSCRCHECYDYNEGWPPHVGRHEPPAVDLGVDRVMAARRYVHDHVCPRLYIGDSCAACPNPLGVLHALRLLDEHPQDAKGARRALHDVVCVSHCGPESDHADRTQAKVAAALRKFRAQEAS